MRPSKFPTSRLCFIERRYFNSSSQLSRCIPGRRLKPPLSSSNANAAYETRASPQQSTKSRAAPTSTLKLHHLFSPSYLQRYANKSSNSRFSAIMICPGRIHVIATGTAQATRMQEPSRSASFSPAAEYTLKPIFFLSLRMSTLSGALNAVVCRPSLPPTYWTVA